MSFFPFHATYRLNGHSFMEQELKQKQISFRKNDNAFLAVDDVAAVQAAAHRLSPRIIRKQLDYRTLILGPKFSKKERGGKGLLAAVEFVEDRATKKNFANDRKVGARTRTR